FFDLDVEFEQPALEYTGGITGALIEDRADIAERQAGIAVGADLAHAIQVPIAIDAVVARAAPGRLQQAHALVIQHRRAAQPARAGQSGNSQRHRSSFSLNPIVVDRSTGIFGYRLIGYIEDSCYFWSRPYCWPPPVRAPRKRSCLWTATPGCSAM